LYIALCYMKLHLVAQAWSVLNRITQIEYTCHPHVYRKGRATPGNVHPQSSTAVTHYLLIATHFTDPRKDGSQCQARECRRELNPGRWRQRRVCYAGGWVVTPSPLHAPYNGAMLRGFKSILSALNHEKIDKVC